MNSPEASVIKPASVLGKVAKDIERFGRSAIILIARARASGRQIEREPVKPQKPWDDLVHSRARQPSTQDDFNVPLNQGVPGMNR